MRPRDDFRDPLKGVSDCLNTPSAPPRSALEVRRIGPYKASHKRPSGIPEQTGQETCHDHDRHRHATPTPSAARQATRSQSILDRAPQARHRLRRARSAGPLPRPRWPSAPGGRAARSPRQRARRRPRREHPRRPAPRGAPRRRRAAGERRARVRALPARHGGSLVQARHRGGSAGRPVRGGTRNKTRTPKRRRSPSPAALTDRQGRTYRLELCSRGHVDPGAALAPALAHCGEI